MELPKWNGWTIDLRLKQFRKVEDVGGEPYIHMHSFDSPEGRAIFKEYCEDSYNYHMESGSAYQRIIFDLEEGSFNDEDAEIVANEMFNGAR